MMCQLTLIPGSFLCRVGVSKPKGRLLGKALACESSDPGSFPSSTTEVLGDLGSIT